MSDIILIEGYAIVAENGEYIILEQTGDISVDVLTTSFIDIAHYSSTYEEAQQTAKDILNNDSKWDYWTVSNPVGVVKIEKTVKIGTVKGLK